MPNEQPQQPAAGSEPAPSGADLVRATVDQIARLKNAAAEAVVQNADADPRSWEPRALEYLKAHPDACKALYRRLWGIYVGEQIAAGRKIKNIRMADRTDGPDCPSDQYFAIVNKAVTELEGGSNLRLVDQILEECEDGTLDCKPI